MPSDSPALRVLYEPKDENAEVDIIAVHGLGSNADWAWTWRDPSKPGRYVKWLQDLDMLPSKVPKSRILLYTYDSRWHKNAPRTDLQICGEELIHSINDFRHGVENDQRERPIIFVGHSLGGNAILHSLLYASSVNGFNYIPNFTVGVIFLGSPLRGTKMSTLPSMFSHLLNGVNFDSHRGIIKELKYDGPATTEKLHSFCRLCYTLAIPVICFFELYETDYGKKFGIKGILKRMIVERESACVPTFERVALQTDHIKLNKYSGPGDRSYMQVSSVIRQMKEDAKETLMKRKEDNQEVVDVDNSVDLHSQPVPEDQYQEHVQAQATSEAVPKNYWINHAEASTCLRDLFVTDPSNDKAILQRSKGKRATGTCEWILKTDMLKSWLDGKLQPNAEADRSMGGKNRVSPILWIKSSPGVGKTAMSIFLAERLPEIFASTTGKTLAYFFCISVQDKQRTATSVVRGLLFQILQQHPHLIKYVLDRYAQKGKALFESFDALWSTFKDVMLDSATGRKYFIIDALDELDIESQEKLLCQLEDDFGENGSSDTDTPASSATFLITSRPYPEIEEYLGRFRSEDLVTFTEYRNDINSFIDYKVKELARRKRYTCKVQKEVTDTLKTKAEGTFLWIGLACEQLSRLQAKDALKLSRGELPEGVLRLYADFLHKGYGENGANKEVITQILTFVAVSPEPMTLLELAAACDLYRDEDEETQILLMRNEIESCRLLRLLVTANSDRVVFLHSSVRDFLVGPNPDQLVDESAAHYKLALRYIDIIMDKDLSTSQERFTELLLQDGDGGDDSNLGLGPDTNFTPFFGKAVTSWAYHAARAQGEFAVVPQQAEFFNVNSSLFQRSMRWWEHLEDDLVGRTVFHVAARWGIIPLLEHGVNLLKERQGTSFVDTEWEDEWSHTTPLAESVRGGNFDAFSRLLDLHEGGGGAAAANLHPSVFTAVSASVNNGEFSKMIKDRMGEVAVLSSGPDGDDDDIDDGGNQLVPSLSLALETSEGKQGQVGDKSGGNKRQVPMSCTVVSRDDDYEEIVSRSPVQEEMDVLR